MSRPATHVATARRPATEVRERLEPGWQTHLMFADFDGSVQQVDDHLVVRSPGSPSYYWGNFLLYDRLATGADLIPWLMAFERDIAGPDPACRHVALGMHADARQFELPPAFREAGFECFASTTLTLHSGQLRGVAAPRCTGLEIRTLDLPQEAPLAVAVDMASQDEGYEPTAYRLFRENQLRRYGRMARAGMGHWFGAFVQGEMVAGLGLFGRDGVGRFQHVSTHPAWRRRGLCRALVQAACRYGQLQPNWQTLVMCADPEDVAIGIYESLGFTRRSTQWSLQRRAPHDRLQG